MFGVQNSVFSEDRHNISGLAFTANNMVQGNCVRRIGEKRHKRESVEAATERSLPNGFLFDGKNPAGGG